MSSTLPVFSIPDFSNEKGIDFYANLLEEHLTKHHFIHHPHKHDFYLTVLFTSGSGIHDIDFTRYEVSIGSLFLLKPGQLHHWELSKDTTGFIFFHSRNFYEERFNGEQLQRFPFFSFDSDPFIQLSGEAYTEMRLLMKSIYNEYQSPGILSREKIISLISLVYITAKRKYENGSSPIRSIYLEQLEQFETLVDTHYNTLKLPRDYASLLHITEKHLNRICRAMVNRSSTELIASRLILEAKRMLAQPKFTITQISDELGFSDRSYFSRFFKKQTGLSPHQFKEELH